MHSSRLRAQWANEKARAIFNSPLSLFHVADDGRRGGRGGGTGPAELPDGQAAGQASAHPGRLGRSPAQAQLLEAVRLQRRLVLRQVDRPERSSRRR